MKKIKKAKLVLSLALIMAAVSFVLCANAEEHCISEWIEYYNGSPLSCESIDKMHSSFTPQCLDCGNITANLSEVLYDGSTLLIRADFSPKDDSSVLILPNSADINDPAEPDVSSRSFIAAAREDKKTLLGVYLMCDKFSDTGWYGADYESSGDGKYTGFSYTTFDEDTDFSTITWKIEVYEFDLTSLTSRYINRYTATTNVSKMEYALEYPVE